METVDIVDAFRFRGFGRAKRGDEFVNSPVRGMAGVVLEERVLGGID